MIARFSSNSLIRVRLCEKQNKPSLYELQNDPLVLQFRNKLSHFLSLRINILIYPANWPLHLFFRYQNVLNFSGCLMKSFILKFTYRPPPFLALKNKRHYSARIEMGPLIFQVVIYFLICKKNPFRSFIFEINSLIFQNSKFTPYCVKLQDEFPYFLLWNESRFHPPHLLRCERHLTLQNEFLLPCLRCETDPCFYFSGF